MDNRVPMGTMFPGRTTDSCMKRVYMNSIVTLEKYLVYMCRLVGRMLLADKLRVEEEVHVC